MFYFNIYANNVIYSFDGIIATLKFSAAFITEITLIFWCNAKKVKKLLLLMLKPLVLLNMFVKTYDSLIKV